MLVVFLNCCTCELFCKFIFQLSLVHYQLIGWRKFTFIISYLEKMLNILHFTWILKEIIFFFNQVERNIARLDQRKRKKGILLDNIIKVMNNCP